MSAFEKNKFVDAVKDQVAETAAAAEEATSGRADQPGPNSTPQEIAEQARRQANSQEGDRTRTERLIDVGRADQTSGRL